MAIAGKPIYAGDPNTLAQLDLQRAIAQDRATQSAISSASRGVQSLLSSKQQKDYKELKTRELGIQEQRMQNEEEERQERYTFEEANRAIREGILDADQIDEIAPTFGDPARQAILREQAKRLRGIQAQVESELPGARDKVQMAIEPFRQQFEKGTQEIQEGQSRWWDFPIPGIGGKKGLIEAGTSQRTMAMQEAARVLAEFEENNPEFKGRLYIGEDLTMKITPKMGGGSTTDVGGSGAPQVPRAGQPGVSTAPEPLPSPPSASAATPMDQKRAAYMGEDVLPTPTPTPTPAPAPAPAPSVAEEPLPVAPTQAVVPQDPLSSGVIQTNDPAMARQIRDPMGTGFVPATDILAEGMLQTTGQATINPASRVGPERGVSGTPYGYMMGPRGMTPPKPDVQAIIADPVTGEFAAFDSSGNQVSLADQLNAEQVNLLYHKMAQFERQGLTRADAMRRAGLWMQEQINAGAF